MALLKVTARWTGFAGAPGYTTFHFDAAGSTAVDATNVTTDVRTFFTAVNTVIPSGVAIQVQEDVEVLDPSTGRMLDVVTGNGGGTAVNGMGTGVYSGPSGAVIHWLTGSVRNGRRLRGRTFLVPLAGFVYENNGTLGPANIPTIQNAATNLLGQAENPLVVFGRPSPGGSDGMIAPATSARVPDLAAVLRSRRD